MRNVFFTLSLAALCLSAHAQAPFWAGAVQTTNPGQVAPLPTPATDPTAIGYGIAADVAGNAYVAGFLGDERTGTNTSTRTFGSTTLSTTGIAGYIAKVSPSLQWQWAVKVSTAEHNFTYARNPALSPTGDVYASISSSDSNAPSIISVGSVTATSPSARNVLVTKVSAAGQAQWIAVGSMPTAAGRANVNAVGWDASTNTLVVVGNYRRSTLVLGSVTLPLPANDRAVFIARLSPGGQWLSATSSFMPTSGSVSIDAAAVSSQGRVAVAYTLESGSLTFAGTTISTIGTGLNNARVGVAQFNAAGQGLSLLSSAGASNDSFYFPEMRYASDNATLWLLLYKGVGVSFGSTTLSGTPQLTAIKVNAQGAWDIVRPIMGSGTSPNGAPLLDASLTLDGKGNVLLIGTAMNGTYTFGTRQLNVPNTTYTNLFLARLYSDTGQWLSAQLLNPGFPAGSASFLEVQGSTLGQGDDLLVLGGLNQGRATFGNAALNNTVNTDVFVAQLRNAGTLAVRQAAGAAPLTVWPNPANSGSAATLRLPAPATAALPVVLRDALGRVVRSATLAAGRLELALPTAGLAPGLYLLEAGASRAQLVVE